MFLEDLVGLPKIEPADAVALLRAARLYQSALWIAESDASLAWVMLVSAAESAATQIARKGGDASRFAAFLLEHSSQEPTSRPAPWAQMSWAKNKLKKDFELIYKYRSRALHNGKPFPAPICLPPDRDGETRIPAEKPLGSKMGQAGGSWSANQLPMFLNTFEYIVRGALRQWFRSLVAAGQQ